MKFLLVVSVLFLLSPHSSYCQFPIACNTETNLQTKTCCPNNCGGSSRGECRNISAEVVKQWGFANPTIVDILLDTPNQPLKGTADARYLWPTVVFENICECSGNFGGSDCNECDFGWTGSDCNTRKTPVIRKAFSRLTPTEQQDFVDATLQLKNEMGFWSVIVEEPATYESGTVTLQDVSTYNFFVFLHDYIARDDSGPCFVLNRFNPVDFAHFGPVFPVWHRRYVMIVEKEYQRIMNNASFGIPYWQWEENDKSPFTFESYGVPSNIYGPAEDVMGAIINPQDWNTICDLTYTTPGLNCSSYWKPCNPANDLLNRVPLQRGGGSTYLPNIVEVMIAIAAPSYDAPNVNGDYLTNDPRNSFRSRVEGWNIICSGVMCTGPAPDLGQPATIRVHNNVHSWVGGQMGAVPVAVNDPTFNLHHCNVDRIIESWMKRFTTGDPQLLPGYVPAKGAHPGHNLNDYMVPFFPLIKAGQQYRVAEEWGYTYDSLIPAKISDSSIPDCSDVVPPFSCPICDANGTCINCTTQTCPLPFEFAPTAALQEDSNDSLALGLGLGLGLGIPLLLTIVIILILIVVIIFKLKSASEDSDGRRKEYDLTVKS